ACRWLRFAASRTSWGAAIAPPGACARPLLPLAPPSLPPSRMDDADTGHLAVSERHVRLSRTGRSLQARARRRRGTQRASRTGRARTDEDLGGGLWPTAGSLRAA